MQAISYNPTMANVKENTFKVNSMKFTASPVFNP